MTNPLKSFIASFYSRPKSKRLLIIAAISVVVLWGVLEGVQGGIVSIGDQRWRIEERSRELAKLQFAIAKYNKLSARLIGLEKTYANSELSVEQVYSEVENIVKAALAKNTSDNKSGTIEGYELRSVGEITSISDTVQQQGYTLKLKALSLSQLVDLLYRLEQGKAPLFLGRLEITKGARPGIFSANLELSSLRKKRTAK